MERATICVQVYTQWKVLEAVSTSSSLEFVARTISGRSRQELEMTAASREGTQEAGAGEREGESHLLLFVLLHLWGSRL